MANLCLIPCKSVSTRIPGKNLRPFLGKPIVEYAIENQYGFDKVVISTDKASFVKKIADKYGVEVYQEIQPPVVDLSVRTIADCLWEFLNNYPGAKEFELVAILLPTSIFCNSDMLWQLVKLGRGNKNFHSAFLAEKIDKRFWRSFVKKRTGEAQMICPTFKNTRTQDLLGLCLDSGQGYVVNVQSFLKNPVIFAEAGTFAIENALETVDIDTPEDWQKAEALYKELFPIKQKV